MKSPSRLVSPRPRRRLRLGVNVGSLYLGHDWRDLSLGPSAEEADEGVLEARRRRHDRVFRDTESAVKSGSSPSCAITRRTLLPWMTPSMTSDERVPWRAPCAAGRRRSWIRNATPGDALGQFLGGPS